EHDRGAIGGLDEAEAAVFHGAVGLDADFGSLEAAGRDATDVERAHGELRAGLADRLRGDDADGVADLRHATGRGIDAVGFRIDAALRRGGERRHDLDALDAELVDFRSHFLGDEFAGADENLGRADRVVDIVAGEAADDALLEADDFVVT